MFSSPKGQKDIYSTMSLRAREDLRYFPGAITEGETPTGITNYNTTELLAAVLEKGIVLAGSSANIINGGLICNKTVEEIQAALACPTVSIEQTYTSANHVS